MFPTLNNQQTAFSQIMQNPNIAGTPNAEDWLQKQYQIIAPQMNAYLGQQSGVYQGFAPASGDATTQVTTPQNTSYMGLAGQVASPSNIGITDNIIGKGGVYNEQFGSLIPEQQKALQDQWANNGNDYSMFQNIF